MGYTGLIFGALAAFWLVYLVPLILNRNENGLLDDVEPGEPFTASVTIVRRGTPLDSAENGTAVVSTPLNRRAALRELAAVDRVASRRRLGVLALLALASTVVGVLSWVGILPWWAIAAPMALIVVFLVVARFSVRVMRRDLDARARLVRGGDDVDEITVPIAVFDEAEDENELSVELSAPLETTGTLWDPIPITAPTYVSRPLMARTVRTIDLSAPVPAVAVPVTADPPVGAEVGDVMDADGRPRAVGE